MASLPQVLRDIHDLKLDPKVAHRTTGVSGRLKAPTKTPEAKVPAKAQRPEPQKPEPLEPNKYGPTHGHRETDPYVTTETGSYETTGSYEASKPLDDEGLGTGTALGVLEDDAPSHGFNPPETKHTKKIGKKDRS